jgi:hypothetical protein
MHDPEHPETTPGIDDEKVQSRASAHPPEETDSDDPEHQARAILEDSEERIVSRAEDSLPEPRPSS